ncbi:MAG: hypothetical protein GPJ51_07030 [Candidatus Heimdallarchaeota archaeon]|nr:hypothetical protein [Candidatus Heimdallarchaeota archaeon]
MSEKTPNKCIICGALAEENRHFCGLHTPEEISTKYKEEVIRIRDTNVKLRRDEIRTCPHCKGVSVSGSKYCVFCGYDQKLPDTNQIIDFFRAEFDFLPD